MKKMGILALHLQEILQNEEEIDSLLEPPE